MRETQQRFIGSIRTVVDGTAYVIEIIKHKDGHRYLYINGALSDVMIPRSIEISQHRPFEHLDDLAKHFDDFWYGQSRYNRSLIHSIFKAHYPEKFI